MKLPLMLLTLLSVQSMASTTIETDSTNIQVFKNTKIVKIQRDLPLGRELLVVRDIRDVRPLREIEEIFLAATTPDSREFQTARTSRENRKTRMVRTSRITREINFVYASPKKSKPIQIAGLK